MVEVSTDKVGAIAPELGWLLAPVNNGPRVHSLSSGAVYALVCIISRQSTWLPETQGGNLERFGKSSENPSCVTILLPLQRFTFIGHEPLESVCKPQVEPVLA
jgi:hypothetical protein